MNPNAAAAKELAADELDRQAAENAELVAAQVSRVRTRAKRREKPDLAPFLDPYQSYRIRSHREGFTGRIYEQVTFVEGLAIVDGLPADAYEDEVEDRLLALEYMANASPTEVIKRRFNEETGVIEAEAQGTVETYRFELIEPRERGGRSRK